MNKSDFYLLRVLAFIGQLAVLVMAIHLGHYGLAVATSMFAAFYAWDLITDRHE